MSERDSKGRGVGSRPLCAIIPFRDGTRYAALSGDGKPGDIVTSQSPYDVGRYCAALMTAVPSSQRREAMRYMMTRVAEAKGEELPMVPIAPFLPEGATVEQDSKIINGLHLMLLALGSAPGDASVGTVTANAAAMAAGVPYASDPMVGERQNEVILAKSILEAALLGDEDAKKWFTDNDLQGALERMATYAAAGGSDQLPIQQSAQARLYQIYDCMQHDMPLGGTPISGDFWSDIWSGIKTAAGNAIVNATKKSDGEAKAADTSSSPGAKVDAETPVSEGEADLREEITKARAALDNAKDAMNKGQENLATYRANLRDAALQSARLQWAQSLLDVPDEVATILSATTPNMSDVSTFLQSVLSILPAAKETGSTSTLKSLLYAIRAATQSAGGDGSLYSLLQGDPEPSVAKDVIVRDAPSWLHALATTRDVQADIAGSAAKELLSQGRSDVSEHATEKSPSAPLDVAPSSLEPERGAGSNPEPAAIEGAAIDSSNNSNGED